MMRAAVAAVLSLELGCFSQTEPQEKIANGCVVSGAKWSTSGVLSCPQSVAAYCAQAPSCPPAQWTEVVSDAISLGWPPLIYQCTPYNAATDSWSCGADTDVLFIYDPSTGSLVGVVEYSIKARAETCLAGSGHLGFVILCDNTIHCIPTDGGSLGKCSFNGTADGGVKD